mgnify:CR=1 FL=1
MKEIHGKIGQVLDDNHIILVCHLTYDLQLLFRQTEPSRIVRVGIDKSRNIALAQILLQFSPQLISPEIIHIK